MSRCTLLVFFFTAVTGALSSACTDKDSCADAPIGDAARGSAMLQVSSKSVPIKATSLAMQSEQAGTLAESRACLPEGLQERHLQAVRRHAALLAAGQVSPKANSKKQKKTKAHNDPYGTGSDPYGSGAGSDPYGSGGGGRMSPVTGNTAEEACDADHMANDQSCVIDMGSSSSPQMGKCDMSGAGQYCDVGQTMDCPGKTQGADCEFQGFTGQCSPGMSTMVCDIWPGLVKAPEPEAEETEEAAPEPETEETEAEEAEPNPAPEPETSAPPNSLSAEATVGSKVLAVVSQAGFQIGDDIIIDAGGPSEEFNKIVGFGTLLLETPLKFTHGSGVLVTTASPSADGATASLNAAGFKEVTALCCPSETEEFFNRLLDKLGYDVCSKPHIQGLMHWFSCVPDMDYQYILDVIANGNPCKYWEKKGTTCPTLSSECEGKWCR